jgi:hypothetical protein
VKQEREIVNYRKKGINRYKYENGEKETNREREKEKNLSSDQRERAKKE